MPKKCYILKGQEKNHTALRQHRMARRQHQMNSFANYLTAKSVSIPWKQMHGFRLIREKKIQKIDYIFRNFKTGIRRWKNIFVTVFFFNSLKNFNFFNNRHTKCCDNKKQYVKSKNVDHVPAIASNSTDN